MLLSSHILAEVEALCDRVSIIRAGRTVQTGTLAELRHLTRTTVIAETARPADRAGRRCPACTTSSSARTAGCASTSTPTTSAPRCALLSESGIRSLISHPPTLEELFLRAVRRAGRALSTAQVVTRFVGTWHPGPADPAPGPPPAAGLVARAVGLVGVSAVGVQGLYGTPQARATYAATVGTSGASIAMSGPPVALDTIGGITVFEVGHAPR